MAAPHGDGDSGVTIADWLTPIAGVGLATGVWWPIRAAIAHRAERAFEHAYRRDAAGVIVGAEPLLLRGTRSGAVLLFHGYNDSPQSVGPLASALHDAGWTVRVPLLPGHGRTLQAFARSGAAAWIRAARDEYAALVAEHGPVAVGGLSMGGALAFLLAAEHPDVTAVIGIAPYLHVSPAMEVVTALGPVAAIGARYIAGGGGRSIHDPVAAASTIAYRLSTPRLLRELSRLVRRSAATLPAVRQPVLVIQSREDNRISVRAAEWGFARVGSPDKTLDWVTGAGHVLTLDYGHAALERRVVDWLDERLP